MKVIKKRHSEFDSESYQKILNQIQNDETIIMFLKC